MKHKNKHKMSVPKTMKWFKLSYFDYVRWCEMTCEVVAQDVDQARDLLVRITRGEVSDDPFIGKIHLKGAMGPGDRRRRSREMLNASIDVLEEHDLPRQLQVAIEGPGLISIHESWLLGINQPLTKA